MPLYFADQRLGGAMVFGQQIGPSNTAVNLGAATFTFAGHAPSVTQGANQAVNPGGAALAFTGYAPTVSQSSAQSVTPGAASLTLTGYAPTVVQSAGGAVSPGPAALSITGYPPTISQTGSWTISPDTAVLSFVGHAPTISQRGSSLLQDLEFALDPVTTGGAWYQVNTSEPPVFPFIVFTRVVSSTNNNLEGPSDLQNTRVQVDLFTLKASEVESLSDAIDAAMTAQFGNRSIQISSQDLYEDAVKAFRVLREYSVWATN